MIRPVVWRHADPWTSGVTVRLIQNNDKEGTRAR